MQASFDHAHKPATCQESVAFSRNAEAAAAEAAEAYPRIHVSAGGQVVAAGRVDAASDGRVLELVRQASQHGVDVVDHARGARGKAPVPGGGGAQVGSGLGGRARLI